MVYETYQVHIPALENQYHNLKQQCVGLEQTIYSHHQTLSKYNSLGQMGFGLKELDRLWYTIKEISFANSIPGDKAVQRFFNDIDGQYDKKLGFESKIVELRGEVKKLNQERSKVREQVFLLQLVGPALSTLNQRGVKDQDIIDIAELLKSDGNIDTREERQLLIAELSKYGGIKSTIRRLNQDADKMKNEVSSLKITKQDLETQNQRMLYTLAYSKQIVDFFCGSADSLMDKIRDLISIYAFIIHMFNLEFRDLKKSHEESGGEFVPLIRATKGEAVPIPKMKMAVIKAIELVMAKLNTHDRLTEILSAAKLA